MGRNFDFTCFYCGDHPYYGKPVAVLGWLGDAMLLTSTGCYQCGIGEYIPDHGRVVGLVVA